MASLYLMEQGSVLRKKSQRLVVEKQGKVLLEIPEFKVDRILIFGNVQLTTQAISFLLSSGIDTSFLTMNGRFKGRLTPTESKNVFLRVKQHEKYLQPQFKLSLAKLIVHAKVKNARTLLVRYSRNHPEINLENAIKELNDCILKVDKKETIKSLMGIEGIAAAIYFEVFGQMLRHELKFIGRNRRPPCDPTNSLLSLGYTLLTNEMTSLLSATGFDPYIGYFHGLDYGRPSLSLDLIEELRHAIIDRFVLYLVNNQIITQSDFENRNEEGVFLYEEAKKSFFMEYEKYMNRQVDSNLTSEKKTYRELCRLKVERFQHTVLNDEPFLPYIIQG